MTRSREWLLLNAVEAWLYHYQSDSPMSEQYKQLQAEFHDAYMATLNKDAEEPTPPAPKSPRKRTRNASQSSAKTI
jgi:hypothetical protein